MSHPLLAPTISILTDLIAFNTESTRSNIDLVLWIQDYLKTHNIKSSTLYNDSHDKLSLLSSIGPEIDGGIVLSGHTDVVDALSQTWETPPFTLTKNDDTLYGRGSCDMKGFIACVLAQAPTFAYAKIKKPIHIALSRDEEIGCIGMDDMLRLMAQNNVKPAAAIVGEPTSMDIVAGHKPGYEMKTIFHGVAAHSAMPSNGCSANIPAAQFCLYLNELSEKMTNNPRTDTLFDPAHGVINVGVIKGGSAVNIVANRCEVKWHYRPLPDEDAEATVQNIIDYTKNTLLLNMQKSGHNVGIETKVLGKYPGLVPDPESTAMHLAKQLTGKQDYTVAPFGADAGHFQKAGIPAILLGPGSIQQAHKPDEFIKISEIENCLIFLDKLKEHLIKNP